MASSVEIHQSQPIPTREGQYYGEYDGVHAYLFLLSAFEKFNIKNTYKWQLMITWLLVRKQWNKQQSDTIIRTQRGRVISTSYSQSGKPVFNSYSDRLLDLFLQPWTNVLETVLQYSYFSVFSWFPLKIVHLFRNFLAVHPPPPYTKLTLGKKKFWIHAFNIVCGVRGGVGPVWSGKHPRNAKVSQDFCPWL